MPVKTIKRVLGRIFRPNPGTVNPSRFSDEKWREREERLQRLHREAQLRRSRRTPSARKKLGARQGSLTKKPAREGR